jgi:sulfofructose kinase
MKARILVVGVAVIDIVMTVDEMPARAEKYRAKTANIVGGGCGGNAAVAVTRLGGSTYLAARLGQDALARLIINGLEAEGIDCHLVRQFPASRSSFSSILIDNAGERQIVNYRDDTLPGDATWLQEATLEYDAILADTRWPEGAVAAMQLAQAKGIPGVLDAESPLEGTHLALQTASHVVFSAQGLREFSAIDNLQAGLEMAGKQLHNFVGVTDGSQGVWWSDHGRVTREPGFSVNTVDTLGAGDVWHGAFALALGEKQAIAQALRFANAAAALKCTIPGGREGIPSRAQTDAFMRDQALCN